jgi:ornithine cyclodeaminase/alanine dehydrogenase-like protein (mu-crystallin family)
MPLIVNDDEVRELLTPADALECVEEAFKQYGLGLAAGDGMSPGFVPPPKRELRLAGRGLQHGDPGTVSIGQGIAALAGVRLAVLQHSFKFANRHSGMFHLIDTQSGETLAIIMNNGGSLSLMRTAADAAVAAKYLSRPDARTAGILGTGRHGKAQLRYLARVRGLERVFAHSGRRPDEAYAREMSEELGIDVVAAATAEDVVANSDVVVLITRATEPVVRGEWLRKGVHLNGIGADDPVKAELDAACMERADKIVIDCEQVLDAGDLRPLLVDTGRGIRIHGNIGEVVAGRKAGRERPDEITVYKSTGTTIPYVMIAARIYEKAQRAGLGRRADSYL